MRILNVFCLFFFVLNQNQNLDARCRLPDFPPFGRWTYINKRMGFRGSQAPERSILRIECSDGYKLDGPTLIFCEEHKWKTEIGKCLKKCPSIFSTPKLNVTCKYKGHQTVNCTEPIEGTLAEFKCASFYEDTGSKSKALCFNGKWSEKVSECAPVCGRAITKKRPTFIINADKTKKGDFPWQIAIYTIRDKNLICGGSLLTEKFVLTAAHCITDNVGTTLPNSDYVVVAGKYYRQLDHPDDQAYSQVLEIEDMLVSDIYEGENKDYIGDIAILITKKPFKFSTRVQPVCIDWAKSLENRVFGTGKQHGFVSGWGNIGEDSNPSNELRSLKVPCLSRKKCHKLLPDDFRRFMTHDKFCAGYKDNGTSVCRGDSGGGLVFKKDERYYIIGIVSVGPTAEKGGCDSQHYTLYTLIYDYMDNFILKTMTEFTTSETTEESTTTTSTTAAPIKTTTTIDKTRVPRNQTKFEKWFFRLDPAIKFRPNSSVPAGTEIRIEKPCPPLSDSPGMKVTCKNRNRENQNCTNPIDGTRANLTCSPFYEFWIGDSRSAICLNGKWDTTSECLPECGQAFPNMTKGGKYPWHVSIYYKVGNGTNYDLVCGGTLVNLRVIITAAHCVAGFENRTVEYFMVAVNNYHRQYRHPDDVNAQFSRVAKILTVKDFPQEYIDIAAMVTTEPFDISKGVRPVCVFWKHFKKPLTNKWATINGFTSTVENINDSEVLTECNLIIPTQRECVQSLFNVYGEFYSSDKFCAKCFPSLLNCPETSLCYGNTGGGLITKQQNRYHLVGVLSITNVTGERKTCGINTYFLFTKVGKYIENFVSYAEAQYRERKTNLWQ